MNWVDEYPFHARRGPAKMSTDLSFWVFSLLSSNEYQVVTGYQRALAVVINAILMAADQGGALESRGYINCSTVDVSLHLS